MNQLIQPNSVVNSEVHIIDYIRELVRKSNRIDIIVSFIKKSGVEFLEEEFKWICDNDVPLRILTGTYLNITEPPALYLLKSFVKDHGEIHLFNEGGISFHPKAYFFYTDEDDYLIIGSSNLSKMALNQGVEWNYRLSKSIDPIAFKHYEDQFNFLLTKNSIQLDDITLKKYSKSWIRPKVYFENYVAESEDRYNIRKLFEPNDPQLEALYELNKIREDGADKAIVVAATGIGKTYLAAFDSQSFNRILFIAHREEILIQAKATFESIGYNSLGILNGNIKDFQSNILFASVQTLCREENLNQFNSDDFDYIVIDECHHSAANSYRRIIEYFKPKFMLGLTATPYRMDNQDIFALMDYNMAYEADLFTAINRGWLVPFYYYGIYDHTVNYDNITYLNGKYISADLEKNLKINRRSDLVISHYLKHRRERALGFCSSIGHADFMANEFSKRGINAVAVHNLSNNRKEALDALKDKSVEVIFSVDMFNEGIDIKEIDMVLFLRPTESPTIFLQQLGRGLRLDYRKSHLVVLDFIGNFKKVSLIPFLLSGKSKRDYSGMIVYSKEIREERFYPEGCRIDFDFQVIELFEKYNRERLNINELITEEISRVIREIEGTPTRAEMFNNMSNEIYQMMKRKSRVNIFKDYIQFMSTFEPSFHQFLNTKGHEFIKVIENTSMSKLYKLPVLLAFYNHGEIKLRIKPNDIIHSFKEFYNNGQNGLDMVRDKSTKNYRSWDDEKYYNLARRNPMHFLQKTHSDFFRSIEDDFILTKELEPFIREAWFINQFKDVVEYRRIEFLKNRLEKL